MFNRVEVDIVHMGGIILVVPYNVFPVTALPDAAFAASDQGGGAGFLWGQRF